jgi:hypothetical protein
VEGSIAGARKIRVQWTRKSRIQQAASQRPDAIGNGVMSEAQITHCREASRQLLPSERISPTRAYDLLLNAFSEASASILPAIFESPDREHRSLAKSWTRAYTVWINTLSPSRKGGDRKITLPDVARCGLRGDRLPTHSTSTSLLSNPAIPYLLSSFNCFRRYPDKKREMVAFFVVVGQTISQDLGE